MIYVYLCEKCKKESIEEFPMGSAPKEIKCKCGGGMKQDFLGKLKSIQTDLPENYKSQSEYHSVDYGSDEDMEAMMSI